MDILLVNQNHPLPDDYEAENIIALKDVPDKRYKLRKDNILLNKTVAENLDRLLKAAADAGHEGFMVNSGYRTREYQKRLYSDDIYGFVQAPGCSEHETGLAFDIVEYDSSNNQLQWITDNSADYGFILRYPEYKEHITGIQYEPWHFRYVGVNAARYIKEHNITLEEYMYEKYNIPIVEFDVKKYINPNEKIIWNFLISRINNPYAVAGIMGNLFAESSLKSKILEYEYQNTHDINSSEYTEAVDNGTYDNFVNDRAGYGLAQWTHPQRKEKLLAYAKQRGRSISDLVMQLEYLWIELTTDYREVYNTLVKSISIQDASDIVLIEFENPKNLSDFTKKTRAKNGSVYYYKFITKQQLEDNLNQLDLWREDMSYLLTDFETGQILYERNKEIVRPIGSITKVMTIYVMADKIFKENRLQELVTIDKDVDKMSRDKNYSGHELFIDGEQWSVETLLNMSLIASGCASTVALARHFYKTDEACIKKMNEVAANLNMSAHFEDVIGVNPNSVASAQDLVILCKEIVNKYPEILSITSKKKYIFKNKIYVSATDLIYTGEIRGMDGLKTGSSSQAGKNILATAARDGKRVIAIVLNSQEYSTRDKETQLLLEYGLARIDESK